MGVGRPRAFDMDEALENALHVFWEKGYEGASMQELTQAMGINKPSLYAAFGNKEKLFRKALDRYTEQARECMEETLSKPTAHEALSLFLRHVVETSTCEENPRGCLLVQGALACGDDAEPIRRELAARRHLVEEAFHKRFEQARNEGELPPHAKPADLARFYATVIHGMAVQTAGGASREVLQSIADMALNAWPGV